MFKQNARQAFDTRGSQEFGCVTLCVHCVRSRGYFEIFVTISIADVPDKAVEIQTGQIKKYMMYGCVVKKKNC